MTKLLQEKCATGINNGLKETVVFEMNLYQPFKLVLLIFLLLFLPILSQAESPLRHFGVISLNNEAIGNDLAGRFKAAGQPIFLVHNLKLGISQGDIIRFRDKVVLIDGDVWQTLQAVGALSKLKLPPIVVLEAKARQESWRNRAERISAQTEKKAYLLGAEILKLLEDYFGDIPNNQELTLKFEGSNLVLAAPHNLIRQLRYTPVRKLDQAGAPVFVSEPPEPAFVDHPFNWQVWAADPRDPSNSLNYRLSGKLPEGLQWNHATHTIAGTPKQSGQWPLRISVINSSQESASLNFTLNTTVNQPPRIINSPGKIAYAEKELVFNPITADEDHRGNQIRLSPVSLPEGIKLDSNSGKIRWRPSKESIGKVVEWKIAAMDPLGASDTSHWSLRVVPPDQIPPAEDLELKLPWDTLLQNQEYDWDARWALKALLFQGWKLKGIQSDDRATMDKGILNIKPKSTGTFTLGFLFTGAGNDSLIKSIEFAVIENQKPVFQSQLVSDNYRLDQRAIYVPLAKDPEGSDIEIKAILNPGFPGLWDGNRYFLHTTSPGIHSAEFLAIDPQGNQSRQRIQYQVSTPETQTAMVKSTFLYQASTPFAQLEYRSRGARVGIFSPQPHRTFREDILPFQVPLFFLGINFLNHAETIDEQFLFFDGGFNVMRPSGRAYGGGLFTRLQGKYLVPTPSPIEVNMELFGYVRQAILGLEEKRFDDDFQVIGGPNSVGITIDSSTYKEYYQELIESYRSQDNIFFTLKMDAWYWLGYGAWVAPVMWTDYFPLKDRGKLRVGGGLRHEYEWGNFGYEQHIQTGWGGASAGFSMIWQIAAYAKW